MEHITCEILEGRVRPGERLPNERELAGQLHISRSAVREALKALQAQGVVTSHTGPGGGTRVATGQGQALGRMLRLHIALDAISFEEVTETRVVLERVAAISAVEHGSPEALRAIADIADEMADVTDAASFNQLDTAFHVAIAGVGANRLNRDITVAIRESVARQILDAEELLEDWEGLRTELVRQHAGIVEAILARDASLAAERVEQHIRGAHAALL